MDRFSLTRESMTMQRLALMQEVPNRAKRDAQIAGAEAKVERERATLAVQRPPGCPEILRNFFYTSPPTFFEIITL